MIVLLSIPPAPFFRIDMPVGLKSLQETVGGSIELVYIRRRDSELVINEESLNLGFMPNREANRLFRGVIGYGNLLCGPVVVVGCSGDRHISVPHRVAEAVMRGVWPPASTRKT
jgi:hypothetical protein